jgi:hypothetical protein
MQLSTSYCVMQVTYWTEKLKIYLGQSGLFASLQEILNT